MKKKKNDINPENIDAFYGELDKKINYNDTINKLNKVSHKLDIFIEPDEKINALEIIQKANMIHRKRKDKIELILFLSAAIAFISSLMALALFNLKTIIIIESLIYLTLPLLIIPFLRFKQDKSEVR
ncbi:DUF5345 family protein [Thermoanaerobacterium sp. RBIITD]|uniref:DUF5345 family protein n=1 Tax=Thermoanaerobacterium sp. RBIITD TaxID=1550240 RepID=UPI000BB6C9F0|nr:DUF5345 family protein [Thermoanaerobacterium sp. RBIITD]SNX53668.1 hypothetical protein SAMN05660242_1228 [Thermoanaerobacterium sp. RBIITD]